MRLPPIARKMTGFSLIEVLVALMVISVGLLGIAKMQALSQSNTQTSGSRAIASILSASLASAMHANKQWCMTPFLRKLFTAATPCLRAPTAPARAHLGCHTADGHQACPKNPTRYRPHQAVHFSRDASSTLFPSISGV